MREIVPPNERIKIGPGQAVRTTRRGADGKERIVFIGLIGEVIDEGDTLRLTMHAPEKLILDRGGAPFPPPMGEHIAAPTVFDFWWKQLDYVFGLQDPRSFPPLPNALAQVEGEIVRRYGRVAGNLAASRRQCA